MCVAHVPKDVGGNNEKDKRLDMLETFKLTAIDEEQLWKDILKIKMKKIRKNSSCGPENGDADKNRESERGGYSGCHDAQSHRQA